MCEKMSAKRAFLGCFLVRKLKIWKYGLGFSIVNLLETCFSECPTSSKDSKDLGV